MVDMEGHGMVTLDMGTHPMDMDGNRTVMVDIKGHGMVTVDTDTHPIDMDGNRTVMVDMEGHGMVTLDTDTHPIDMGGNRTATAGMGTHPMDMDGNAPDTILEVAPDTILEVAPDTILEVAPDTREKKEEVTLSCCTIVGGGYASGFPAFDDYGSYGRRGKFGAYDYYDYDDGYGRGRGRQARRRGHRNDGYGDDIYPDDYSYEESSEEYFDYEDYGGRGGGRRGGRGRHRGRGNRNNGRQEHKAGNNRRNEPTPQVVTVPVPIAGYPDTNQAFRQIQLPLAVPSAFGRAAQPLQPFDVTTLNDLGSSQTTSQQQVVPYAPWQVPLALRTGYQNSQAQTTGLIQEPPGAVLSSLLRSQGPTTTQFQQIPSYEPQQQTLFPSYFTPQPLQNPPNFQPTQPGRLLPGLSVSNYRLRSEDFSHGPGYPGEGYAGESYPGEGYAGEGYAGEGYAGEGYPGQGYPGRGFPGGSYPGQGYPHSIQGYPPGDGYPPREYPLSPPRLIRPGGVPVPHPFASGRSLGGIEEGLPAARAIGPDQKDSCGIQMFSSIGYGRISVGFNNQGQVKQGEFPWHCPIIEVNTSQGNNYKPQLRYICGSSLVTEEHVVTAADCVDGLNANNLMVICGDIVLNSNRGEQHPKVIKAVENITMHGSFDSATKKNDVAVLKLKTPIDLANNPHIGTICLPGTFGANADITSDYEFCFLPGYGSMTYNADKKENHHVLLKATMVPLNKNQCHRQLTNAVPLNANFRLLDNTVCYAGRYGEDACKADAGGGLACGVSVAPNENCAGCPPLRFILAGVFSWSASCGLNTPAVFTDITATTIRNFIIDACD
ncbi:unnamed protein product [Cyprideis torosa]|uniref:Uncharacterized protein n=1 Tax=Cyprideis torosa TaxID=163714 RepID=A0A7R8ZMF7_9CRUS|nr:unnamed protein product [Cyprideis torosa]CAG0888719.1 unnamed protein product [Cyprideis torosa]